MIFLFNSVADGDHTINVYPKSINIYIFFDVRLFKSDRPPDQNDPLTQG